MSLKFSPNLLNVTKWHWKDFFWVWHVESIAIKKLAKILMVLRELPPQTTEMAERGVNYVESPLHLVLSGEPHWLPYLATMHAPKMEKQLFLPGKENNPPCTRTWHGSSAASFAQAARAEHLSSMTKKQFGAKNDRSNVQKSNWAMEVTTDPDNDLHQTTS